MQCLCWAKGTSADKQQLMRGDKTHEVGDVQLHVVLHVFKMHMHQAPFVNINNNLINYDD